MSLTKQTVQTLANLVGIPLPDDQAAALAALQEAARANLARYPDAALIHVEPQIWFRPIPGPGEGRP